MRFHKQFGVLKAALLIHMIQLIHVIIGFYLRRYGEMYVDTNYNKLYREE